VLLEREITKAESSSGTDSISRQKFISSYASKLGEWSALRSVLPRLIDDPSSGDLIINMSWRVIDVSSAKFELLTSDRPLFRAHDRKSQRSLIALPLNPKRLFTATHKLNINSMKIDLLVSMMNDFVVRHAIRRVYGSNTRQVQFVTNRLGPGAK
jgi:hypothetical protein